MRVAYYQALHATYKNRFNRLGEKLSVKHLDAWYTVPKQRIFTVKGVGITRNTLETDGPLINSLRKAYPKHDWDDSKFEVAPHKHWSSPENQIQKLEAIAEKLNVKHVTDWQRVKIIQVKKLGGGSILNIHYGGSLRRAISMLYPDAPRLEQRKTRDHGFWTRATNQRNFLKSISADLHIKKMEDWYRVSYNNIKDLGGSALRPYYPYALQTLDPFYVWDWSKFDIPSKKSMQRLLFHTIQRLWPSAQISEEHCIGIKKSTGTVMTVDIFIADFNIAVEYQGEQHYFDRIFPEGLSVSVREARDTEKLHECERAGITLIAVPYWWDGIDVDAVAATIKHHAPHVQFEREVNSKVKPLITPPKKTSPMPVMLPNEIK